MIFLYIQNPKSIVQIQDIKQRFFQNLTHREHGEDKINSHQKSIQQNQNAPEFIRNAENGLKPIENDAHAIVSVIRHEKHLNSWNNIKLYQASVDFDKKLQNII